MSTLPIPPLTAESPWRVTDQRGTSTTADLTLQHESAGRAQLRLERCVAGRLEDAYPASVHDVEIQVVELPSPGHLTSLLVEAVRSLRAAEPSCRRVVFGAPVGQPGVVAAAEGAGFRYVVDVDLPDDELSLLVAEPEWVSVGDEAADDVPGA